MGNNTLGFEEFAKVNRERVEEWHSTVGTEWDASDWAVAVTGEWGQACNLLKKLKRGELGLAGNKAEETFQQLHTDLGEEMADTLTYLFCLADAVGVDLPKEVRDKFNKVSEKFNFNQRL